VQPAPLWGDESHVRRLFGERVAGAVAVRQTIRVDRFATAQEFVDFFKAAYGPTIVAYRRIADEPDKIAALDAALVDLGRRHGADTGTMAWEYLLFTARKV